IGGPYNDNSSTRDVIVRDNFYRNVQSGASWTIATPVAAVTLSALVRDSADAANKTAKGTTSQAHRLQPGDRVLIGPTGQNPATDLHGVFIVSEIVPADDPTSTQFKYKSEIGFTTSSTTATMQKVFGPSRVVAERNTIELVPDVVGV